MAGISWHFPKSPRDERDADKRGESPAPVPLHLSDFQDLKYDKENQVTSGRRQRKATHALTAAARGPSEPPESNTSCPSALNVVLAAVPPRKTRHASTTALVSALSHLELGHLEQLQQWGKQDLMKKAGASEEREQVSG